MLDLAFIIFGLLLVTAMMVLVINPPEAWIKRVFYGKKESKPEPTSDQ